MRTIKRKFLLCAMLSILSVSVVSAQQDNSLKPGTSTSKADKKLHEKQQKELDKMHEKDKKKLAGQFSEKKQYKKDFKVKPAQGTQPAQPTQPTQPTAAKGGGL
jgi:hypothetical protein